MANPMNTLMPLILVGFVVVFGLMYFTSSMAVLDDGVNMTNNSYEDTYNTTRDTTKLSISFMGMMPYFFGIGGLIFAVVFTYKMGK